MLGHDWASPEATYHSYDLMARKVIPHFKGQLAASRVLARLGQRPSRPTDRPRRRGRRESHHRACRRAGRRGELMRASVLRDGRMVYRDDVPDPVPGPGQVLVAIRACGICGSDMHFAAHGDQVLEMSRAGRARLERHGRRSETRRLHGPRIQRRGARSRTRHRDPSGRNPRHVDSGAVVRQGGGADRLQQQHHRRLRRTDAALGAAAAARSERPGPQACRPDRTHGGGAARRQQVRTSRPARPRWCWAAARSASRSSRPFARVAWKTLWHRIFRRNDGSWPARWAPTRRWMPRRVRRSTLSKPRWCSRRSGCPESSTTCLLRARPGTRLVVAGVCMESDTFHPFFAIAKEINVQFSLAYGPEEFAESLRSLAEGEIDVSPLITGEVGPGRGRGGLRQPRRPRAALQDSRHALGPAGSDGAVDPTRVPAFASPSRRGVSDDRGLETVSGRSKVGCCHAAPGPGTRQRHPTDRVSPRLCRRGSTETVERHDGGVCRRGGGRPGSRNRHAPD